MKLDFDKRWRIDASPAAGWKLLADQRRLVGCMPGAKVSARPDERHLVGSFALKIGTASLAFNGRLEVVALDEARRTLKLRGDAADAAGTSKVRLELSTHIDAGDDAESCTLAGRAEVHLDGKAAAFGAPALQTAAEWLFRQFARRFAEEARLVQGRLPKPVAVPAVAPAASPVADAPVQVPAVAAPVAASPAAHVPLAQAQPESAAPPAQTLWSRFVAWLRRLLGGR